MEEKFSGYEEKARQIIEENNYMVLATSDTEATPWAATVFYACSNDYRFYFLSAIDSRHAENITANPKVAIAIFDSRQKMGRTDGIEIEARVSVVKKEGITEAITLYSKKVFPRSDMPPTDRYIPSQYLPPSEFRFFEAVPSKIFVTGVDRRVEVFSKTERE